LQPATNITSPIVIRGLLSHSGGPPSQIAHQIRATTNSAPAKRTNTVHTRLLDRCWTRGEGWSISG
jgi:hypothetical protein